MLLSTNCGAAAQSESFGDALPNSAASITIRSDQEDAPASLVAESRLVVVPALVRDAEGALIAHLQSKDFVVTDNGSRQDVRAEEMEHQPLALVVVMGIRGVERGGRNLKSYQTLRMAMDAMLGSTAGRVVSEIGNTTRTKVGLVTLGSTVEQIWNFPPRVDGLRYAFRDEISGGVASNPAVEATGELDAGGEE